MLLSYIILYVFVDYLKWGSTKKIAVLCCF